MLLSALSRKRRADGEPLSHVLCALLVWPLLHVRSLHCFCAELCQILAGQVGVLYDFLDREDINWRGLSSELARRVQQASEPAICWPTRGSGAKRTLAVAWTMDWWASSK